MANADCLIVRAVGRKLDEVRSEASRIAKGSKLQWWAERNDKGTCFCFEDAGAKNKFATFCQNFGVPHQDG